MLLWLDLRGSNLEEVMVVLASGGTLRCRRLQALALAQLAEKQHLSVLLGCTAGRCWRCLAWPRALPLKQGGQVLRGQPGVGVAR